MQTNPATCAECGARLTPDATHCDLCGLPVGPDGGAALTDGAAPSQAIYCNDCGWENPSGSRFCSKCGKPVQAVAAAAVGDLPAAPPPPPTAPAEPAPDTAAPKADRGMESQTLIVVGAGLLVVVALWLLTVTSKELNAPTPATAVTAPQSTLQAPPAPPLDAAIEAQATDLQQEIATLTEDARVAKQRELMDLYVRAGRLDLAAQVQTTIAETLNTEQAWALVGNLYYDWMERHTGQDRSFFAKKAIVGYQRALDLNPDNLDLRTDMAIAYLYDPDNPMQAIQQTNRVLEQEPNHLQANFNRGIMLMQINRLDQSLEQFEKVKTLIGDPENSIYQRAEEAIKAVQRMQAGS